MKEEYTKIKMLLVDARGKLH